MILLAMLFSGGGGVELPTVQQQQQYTEEEEEYGYNNDTLSLRHSIQRAYFHRWVRRYGIASVLSLLLLLGFCTTTTTMDRGNNNTSSGESLPLFGSAVQWNEDDARISSDAWSIDLFSPFQEPRYYPPWKSGDGSSASSSSHHRSNHHKNDTQAANSTTLNNGANSGEQQNNNGTASLEGTIMNPSVYGWSPELYPNPSSHPAECHIPSSSMHNNTTPIRLCDPDTVLVVSTLDAIARVMTNFSHLFDTPLAVAAVAHMNLPAVLRQASYYTYEEDEDDMANDAAQIFARQLHERWAVGDMGIVLFLSVEDHICFISTGGGLTQVLPWWRLDQIVNDMKSDLRHREYGNAILQAIDDLSYMLLSGPPTWSDRLHDFFARYVRFVVSKPSM